MTLAVKPKIVVVEDDATLAFMMDEICTSAGYEVVGCVGNASEAMELVENDEPNLLIIDFNLEGQANGLELISIAKSFNPDIRTVLVTGWDINDIASRVGVDQPDRILRKPVAPQVLVEVIGHIFTSGSRPAATSPSSPGINILGRSH